MVVGNQHVTETTAKPVYGCQCVVGCQAHINPGTGADETAEAPVMFLVKREGELLHVCPSCVHVMTDLILARTYNQVMDLKPFIAWAFLRFLKLLELFRFALPVEADYYTNPEAIEAKATENLAAVQQAAQRGIAGLLGKLRAAVPAADADELEGALTGPMPLGKFRES